MKRRLTMFHLRFFIIFTSIVLHSGAAYDDSSYQQIIKQSNQPQNGSVLITKLLNINQSRNLSDVETSSVNSLRINQSLDVATSDSTNKEDDQSYNIKSQSKPKYVNKSASNLDKKNSMLLKKSLSVEQTQAAMNGSWKCPNITDNRSLECQCDMPLTLRCSGDVHGLALIADVLRKNNTVVSFLDCSLKNVTVLNEAKIFENVSLSGLFISSGEIKRVNRNAFAGLKIPLQILGLPNNALSSVPSTSLQQLTSLDRLDLSNNDIKILSPTDFLNLQKLTYLEISENQISSISQKTFIPLKNLVSLKMNGNKLGDSPGSLKTIAECVNLRDLDLSSNLIKGPLMFNILPAISGLESLNLERNSFSSVHSGTFQNFNKLVTLSLRYNQIDVLQDDAFIGLNSLQRLDLSFNGIVAVSERSLKHMNRLILLDFTHNFLRAITADIIAPLPQLKELKLDGNDISIIEKNAMNSAMNLKILSLRDNPLACDCKLQYFSDWLGNSTRLSAKDLMAFCKTPPFLEGAELSQLPTDSLTCTEVGHLDDNDKIMRQVNSMFIDVSDNFTMTNSSGNIHFVDYNFTTSNVLNLNWILHLNKTIDFHSLVFFEGYDVRIKMEKSTITYRSMVRDMEEYFVVSVPSTANLILGASYEFCLIFSEDDFHFFIGCSNSFILEPRPTSTIDLNSRILQSSIRDSDISSFESIADKKNNQLYMNDDMLGDNDHQMTMKTVKKSSPVMIHDDSIEVYPSHEYYNTLWPNISLSVLIICMSISIVYILWTKYRFYYKHQTESISPSYSEDSINTSINTDDENDNTTNKYVKLQATTTL